MLLAVPLVVTGDVRPDARVLLLDQGRVSIHSKSTPLTEILSRFAQATGAEIVYESARPRQLVSVVIEAGTAAEAIAQLLEGQGLNYALRLDPTGKKVEMLVITGSTSPTPAAAGAGRSPRPVAPAVRSPEEETVADPGEIDEPFALEGAEGLEPSAPPATPAGDVTNPAMGAPWPGALPSPLPGTVPSSPGSGGFEGMSGSAPPEAGQPQIPAVASYPGSVPVSPPVPPPPVFPRPASY